MIQMNMKVYEKTRYQNIYRHKKNKNYMIMISKPVKTSISKIDGKRILSIEEALKIRDNPKIKQQKGLETVHKEDFDTLWDKYILDCKNVKKLAYNTINRKQKDYKRYLKNKITINVSKTNKNFWANFIEKLNCSNKQKNQILRHLKACFNWCIENDYLIINPVNGINKYKVVKTEMKFWTPKELKIFIDCVNNDLDSPNIELKKKAYLVKTLTLICFNLGDRIGETRALTFDCISDVDKTISIFHSIEYDPDSKDLIKNTKNYQSQRTVDITDKLINIINEYKDFLKNELKYPVKDNSIIFFNYTANKPFSDTTLREHFYYYCEKSKVKKIRLYDLRHTYVATMMAEGKELYYISTRIGHKDYSTTVNKYGHLSNEVRKEIAKSTDKYY